MYLQSNDNYNFEKIIPEKKSYSYKCKNNNHKLSNGVIIWLGDCPHQEAATERSYLHVMLVEKVCTTHYW